MIHFVPRMMTKCLYRYGCGWISEMNDSFACPHSWYCYYSSHHHHQSLSFHIIDNTPHIVLMMMMMNDLMV